MYDHFPTIGSMERGGGGWCAGGGGIAGENYGAGVGIIPLSPFPCSLVQTYAHPSLKYMQQCKPIFCSHNLHP